MEYTGSKLSKMSGVSARTLRYYDEINLLKPARVASSGYRIYGQNEVDRLQQILFYRELGFPLAQINKLMSSPDFDKEQAFLNHLAELTKQKQRLDSLINNVKKSMAAMKGETTMTDSEKFESFKKNVIENERKYGEESRARYGDDAVDRANAGINNMTKEQFVEYNELMKKANAAIKAAFEQGDPASDLAQEACWLHKNAICFFWKDYSKEAHLGVAQLYIDDPRFTEYLDKIMPGRAAECAVFLRDALQVYCGEQ